MFDKLLKYLKCVLVDRHCLNCGAALEIDEIAVCKHCETTTLKDLFDEFKKEVYPLFSVQGLSLLTKLPKTDALVEELTSATLSNEAFFLVISAVSGSISLYSKDKFRE